MEIGEIFNSDKSSLVFLIWGLAFIVFSGMAFTLGYFILDTTQTSLESMDCDLPGNAFGETCQDLFTLVVYPALNFKVILIYLSYFFIFILVLGMLLTGYNSGTRPWMLGILVLIEIGLTYGSFYVANVYRLLLENEIIRDALIPFTAYHKIMTYFPWFVFVVSLFSLALGVVNWQRTRRNTPTWELDY
jgi:F0F1-type ATP synthase assembly protein I